VRPREDDEDQSFPFGVSMIVIPGLSESLDAVGKRIVHVDITDTLLGVCGLMEEKYTLENVSEFNRLLH
jgi:hypothetical protein